MKRGNVVDPAELAAPLHRFPRGDLPILAQEVPMEYPPRKADYLNIPDHSDLRGFSYHAPENFDYHDETKRESGLWRKILAFFGGRS